MEEEVEEEVEEFGGLHRDIYNVTVQQITLSFQTCHLELFIMSPLTIMPT